MNDKTQMERGYISRELSWMDFNSRVLDEACDMRNPVVERLKFIAIFSSNLDEFFMVRIAGLRQLVKLNEDTPDAAGVRPSEQLLLLRKKIDGLLHKQRKLLDKTLLELTTCGIRLLRYCDLPPEKAGKLERFFHAQILPVLTPLAVDPSHPFPVVSSGAIELAVSMVPPHENKTVYAFVEVPELLPRFIPVPSSGDGDERVFVLLEELIMAHLGELFVNCRLLECVPFRITRDMDFAVDGDGAEDLMQSIERNLLKRRSREPIRLELGGDGKNIGNAASWLQSEFQIEEHFIYYTTGFLHIKQFFELAAKAASPELCEAPWPSFMPPELEGPGTIFERIKKAQVVFIATPFHSFSPVISLLEEAAEDPDVLAIKQTLYRVSGNSPVVRALQRAAENGKQVTVIVELKARFDEGNNIQWAKRLEESGAHVVYGVSKLKIHCKALLIVRREDCGIRRYLHLSTGNYNDRTATQYTDIGLMSCDPELCFDTANLFNVMTGYSAPPENWCKLAAAPFNLREKITALIDRETRLAQNGSGGMIVAKMNSLSDREVIRHLRAAAAAGVVINLIVRGICCFKVEPGCKNVRIISIVDRYLEHSRVFYFRNGGDEEYYLSSADWMYRNLSCRIELLFPVTDQRIRKILCAMLKMQQKDDAKGRRLLASGNYVRGKGKFRSQYETWKYLKNLAGASGNKNSAALQVFTSDGNK